MKISILTEGGTKFGYGHLTRCLALAQAMQELSCEIKFFINGDDSSISILDSQDYTLYAWNEKYTKFEDGELVIVDSYNVTTEQLQTIVRGRKSLFLDDHQRIHYPNGGWVWNGCPNVSSAAYNSKEKLLLGKEYLLIRKSFWDLSKAPFRLQDSINRVLVIFGGSDILNLVPYTTRLILSTFPKAEICIIQGKNSRSLLESEQLNQSYENVILKVEPNIDELISCMSSSDIAISGAGQTLHELIRIGVPTIAVKVIDNQQNNINSWSDLGCILPVDGTSTVDYIKELSKALLKFSSYEIRKSYLQKTNGVIDGQGARRVAKIFVNNSA